MKKHKQNKLFRGEIRIIGGRWRGRKLSFLSDTLLRPTTDRVKETVFNWLAPHLNGSSCLDCYAGSGSLGFEAFSRGAINVVLIEKKETIYQQLINNHHKLGDSSITIIHDDVLHYLRFPPNALFNIVFIDPPFRTNLINQTAILLEKNGWLSENSLIYIERNSDGDPLILPKN